MNWDALGALAEMFGAAAVFVTLVYLSVQVRQARSEARRALAHARADTARGLLTARASDARLGGLYVKATLAIEPTPPAFVTAAMAQAGLTAEDAAALYWDQLAWWQYRLEVIPYVHELPDEARQEFEQGIRLNYGAQPLERLFYETSRAALPADAVRYIDALLEG